MQVATSRSRVSRITYTSGRMAQVEVDSSGLVGVGECE